MRTASGYSCSDPLRAPQVREDGIVSGSAELAGEAVVHGWLRDGRAVSLLRLRGWSMPADGLPETWIAEFAVTGGHISGDAFNEMTVIFDYLMPWVQPPGITRSDLLSSSFTVETQQATLAQTELGDGRTVRLVTGVEGDQTGASVHLDQWCGSASDSLSGSSRYCSEPRNTASDRLRWNSCSRLCNRPPGHTRPLRAWTARTLRLCSATRHHHCRSARSSAGGSICTTASRT